MAIDSLFFYILAALAVATGLVTITRKNPVTAAAFLVLHFFSLAGLYLTLQAQLLAVLLLLVYAGAIMVLVVFVIMLLNLGDEEKHTENVKSRTTVGIAMAIVLVVQLGVAFFAGSGPLTYATAEGVQTAQTLGTAEGLGMALFTQYIFPFEAVSLLLLAAIVGAIMLAKKKIG